MADKFKKIDKEFLLTNSSLNSYKYRLLTSGYLIDEYKKNPIGYFMHGTKDHPREQGVLVKWEDLRMEGDNVYGKPCINLNHPRGQKTVEEVENGFLNGASFGHFVILSVSDNPKDYLQGQEGPTVNKWFNRECSLVDIPGNYDSLTDLYDEKGNPLKLEDLIAQQKKIKMEKLFLTPEQITKLNLKADPKQDDVNIAIADLIAKAAKVDELAQLVATANGAKVVAEAALADLKASTVKDNVKSILEKGLADKKFTAEMKAILEKQYATNPEGLQSLVDVMKPYEGVVEKLDAATATTNEIEIKNLIAMKADELFKGEGAERLKVLNLAAYKVKHKEFTGEEYKEPGKVD